MLFMQHVSLHADTYCIDSIVAMTVYSNSHGMFYCGFTREKEEYQEHKSPRPFVTHNPPWNRQQATIMDQSE